MCECTNVAPLFVHMLEYVSLPVCGCLCLNNIETDTRRRQWNREQYRKTHRLNVESVCVAIKQSGRAGRKRLNIDFQKNKNKANFNFSTIILHDMCLHSFGLSKN